MQLPARAVLDRRSCRNEKFVHAREPSLEPTKHLEPCPHGSREPSEGRRLARTSRPVERIRGRADRLPSGIRGGLFGAAAARHEQHLWVRPPLRRSASV